MAGAFLLTSAPSGASWEQELNKAPPALDGNGFVTGAWGECIHYAIVFENLDSGWKQIPDFSEDGPVGQVVNFAIAKGFSGFEEALNKTEDATKAAQANGNNGFVFQQQQQSSQPQPAIMGMSQVAPAPIQQMMVPPAQQTMMVQVPPGSGPGSLIQVATPNGQQVQVTVPQGVGPGQQFAIVIPGNSIGHVQTVPMEAILTSLQRHSKFEIIEKADMKEMAANFVLDMLTDSSVLNIDLPNKYSIRAQNGGELFYAMGTSSILQSSLGWVHAVDVVYTEGGSPAPLWKIRGDGMETTVANAVTDEAHASIWEDTEAWCCPVKKWSRFGCHGGYVEGKCCCFGPCACCCECCCEICCCCMNASTYLIDMNEAPGTIQTASSKEDINRSSSRLSSSGRQKSREMTKVKLNKTDASIAIVDKRCITLPWILTGCFGEGSDWVILKNPKLDVSQKPLIVWNGKEIGTLRRKGKGLIATCCLPNHDSDHWKLDLSGTSDSKDKLAVVAMVLFMDHANTDQVNDA